jgi:hypothetical protein
MRDKIADGPMDLENGTVDLDSELMHDEYPSPNEDEFDFISLGLNDDDMEELDIDETSEMEDDINDPYEFDIDEMEDYSTQPMNETDFEDEVDDEILPEFVSKLNESLDMFKRFKNYN